ncbi:MAG TPA: tagatose 1,6-diphosphate aldolase, partial [Bryobacteraceae bacterium]
MEIRNEKIRNLNALTDTAGVMTALAIDQRKSLRRPIAAFRGVAPEDVSDEMLAEFKSTVSRILSPFASAVLLDPEYGLEAGRSRPNGTGLLLTYEADGYENPRPHRMLALIPDVSVERLKAWGANGVKILLSYTPFDDPRANQEKQALIERIGNECAGAGLPFLLELVGYDAQGSDETGLEFAKMKPEIVIRSVQEFSRDIYKADVLKVQVPVNAKFLEGSCVYKGQRAYTYAEALEMFRRASEATTRPFVYLSAGVSHEEFTESLRMAAEAGAQFSGILCGRATWNEAIPVYARQGLNALEDWLGDRGVENIRAVNELVR